MLKRLALLAVAVVAGTSLVAGQQPPPPQTPPVTPPPQGQQPAFKAGVEMVRIDVSVLDSRRLPVKGLTIDDFRVLENGKPQKVSTFSEVEVADPVVPTTDWMRDVAMDIRRNDDLNDRRLILIVLDDAMIDSRSLHSVASVKTAARAIVDQMGPADLGAVVYTADSRSQQEFTGERAKLLGAIDRFSGGVGGDQELFERYSVGALLRASEILAEIPQRRKALFYISTGVALDLNAIARPTFAGKEGTGGDPTGRAAWIKDQMQEVFRQAQMANVNIHAIDPSSLDGLAGANGVLDPHKDFLFAVSENTGGFPIVNRSDYAEAIAQVFLENSSYYLIGYEPMVPDDGNYRRLEVIANRPGLTVRARSGYYAPDAVKAVKSSKGATANGTASPLWKAIAGLMPIGDLPLQVTAAPFASVGKMVNGRMVGGARGEATVAVALGIIQDVETGEDRKTEHIEFLIDAFGQDGTSKSVHGLKADVTFKPNVNGKVGYEVLTRIDLKPGRYQLRLSAHLPSLDKSGSIYYDVDVPDFTKGALAMSGAMISAMPALVAAPRDKLLDLMPIVPTTNRYFAAKTDQVSAFVSVYQPKGPLKAVELTTKITDSNGTEVVNNPATLPIVAFGGDRRAAGYRFTVPVAKLEPGQYLLTFVAVLGKDTVRRDVRFVVQ